MFYLIKKSKVFALLVCFCIIFSGISSAYATNDNLKASPPENTDIELVLNKGTTSERKTNSENGFDSDLSSIENLTLDYGFKNTDSGIKFAIAGYRTGTNTFSWSDYQDAKTPPPSNFSSISEIKFKLTGSIADTYDIYYAVKIAPLTGWLDYAKNEENSGFASFSGKKITNLKIRILEKGFSLNPGGLVEGYKINYLRSSTYITKNKKFYSVPYETGISSNGNSKSLINKTKKKIVVKITEQAKTKKGIFVLISYQGSSKGWIDINAFDHSITRQFDFDTKIKSYKNYNLYTKMENEAGELLSNGTYGKGRVLETAYKYVTNFNQTFFILDNGQIVNSKNFIAGHSHLKKGNKKVEKAIKAGFKLAKKSKYLWGGGRTKYWIKKKRFDCSSFSHYAYSKAGKKLGHRGFATTATLKYKGKKVKYKNLKRGDLIFFAVSKTNKRIVHMGIYLGNSFFLHDSPATDSGGVDIDSLNDPIWKSGLCGKYRRVA